MESGWNLPGADCVLFHRGEQGADSAPAKQSWGKSMVKFLLFCILFLLCWPLALLAIVLYPLVWLILLPFRLAGIAVHGALELVVALITLPARLLRAI
jgi:hypothetical protein